MACNVNTLLANGAALQNLDDGALRLVIISLLKNWATARTPGLDVTPSAVLARGATLQYLDSETLWKFVTQALCNAKG